MSVQVVGLAKRYPGALHAALHGLSLEISSGSTAAILGRSGAGKSTLLRCLVGLETFDEGSVTVDGVQIPAVANDAPAAEREAALRLLRGRVGFVFQSFELFPHLSVLDNCTLAPRKVRHEAKGAAEARAKELLARLGLGDKAQAYPEQLSGGQKQRVAIARALAMDPKVLFYDEPTSALDPALRNEVRDTLRSVSRTGVTQVVVTHDLAFARDASDQVFVLSAGRVAESGPPGEVLVRPQHEATKALLAE